MNAVLSNAAIEHPTRSNTPDEADAQQALGTALRTSDELWNISSLLERVEANMHRVTRGNCVDRTGAMALETLDTGGKRFRARLALHACRALGVVDTHAVAWASAVELLHNATLIHDDVQDGDTTRRGKPTLWVNHGVPQAINAGDFMLMLPFLALADLPSSLRGDLSLLVADYATRIVRGQVEELSLRNSGRIDSESYLNAAAGKTGALIALPVIGAAKLAGRTRAEAERLSDLFVDVGLLFQLQDDVVDLFGDKGRKEVGCDIYEGKISALVVAHLECAPHSAEALLEIIDRPRSQTTAHDVERAHDMFLASGALTRVLETIECTRRSILADPGLNAERQLHRVAERVIGMALQPVQHLLATTQEKRA